jgi:hypothetical protein
MGPGRSLTAHTRWPVPRAVTPSSALHPDRSTGGPSWAGVQLRHKATVQDHQRLIEITARPLRNIDDHHSPNASISRSRTPVGKPMDSTVLPSTGCACYSTMGITRQHGAEPTVRGWSRRVRLRSILCDTASSICRNGYARPASPGKIPPNLFRRDGLACRLLCDALR